jgi:hypothetical protein
MGWAGLAPLTVRSIPAFPISEGSPLPPFPRPGEKVVLLVRQTGTGKTSGVPAEIRYGQVFVVHNSVIVSMKTYLDRAEALEAAGLRE